MPTPSITITDGIYFHDLLPDEVSRIKEDLTFPNPKYSQVKKYSKYSYTKVPPHLFYYEVINSSTLKVPIGYSIPEGIHLPTTDNRVLSEVQYPEFQLTLRDTQVEAATSYIKANALYLKSVNSKFLFGCIQMPTGKGKSILGLYLASFYRQKTLIVVHKNDLITGWKKDIALCFDGKVTPGLIKSTSRRIGKHITLATVQTLSRLTPEEQEELFNEFGMVILDEMHHCASPTFEVVSHFKSRYKLGLTATPERSDGLDHIMNLYFGDFCFRYTSDSEDKDILPVEVKVKYSSYAFTPSCARIKSKSGKITYDLSPSGIPITSIPYNERPRVPISYLDSNVIENNLQLYVDNIIREYDKGHSCLVFVSQIQEVDLLYDALREYVSPTHLGKYYGSNKDSENDAVLQKAESTRKFITIATYSKATEGTNVKQWEVLFLLSSINNGKNVEQAVGRIRRTNGSNKINPVLVYDFRYPNVYSIKNHGFNRDQRYKELGFKVVEDARTRGLFSRGFN